MQHPDEGTIHSWLDGALGSGEAARVEAHVKECPECAAAVAEARGFIAASSRILTALDNAPRGVIPATVPKKRFDPLVWRVAASVLVVAAGTLVVLQNRGGDESLTAISSVIDSATPHQSSARAQMPVTSAPATSAAANTAAADERGKTRETTASTPAAVVRVGKGATGSQREDINARESKSPAVETVPTRQRNLTVQGYAGAVLSKASELTSRVEGAVAMDAAFEAPRLKVVGTPSRIGVKVTLYEVAPGDTVTLTEPASIRLTQSVTVGAAAAPVARRTTEKAPTPPSNARADAATTAQAEAQLTAALPSAPPPVRPPSIPAPIAKVEFAGGVTAISWVDAATGKVLTLSGRIPEAQLREIKIRIERERAAANKSP